MLFPSINEDSFQNSNISHFGWLCRFVQFGVKVGWFVCGVFLWIAVEISQHGHKVGSMHPFFLRTGFSQPE